MKNIKLFYCVLLSLLFSSLAQLNAQCTDDHAGTGTDLIANTNAGQSFQPSCTGTLNTIAIVGNAATTGHTVTLYSGLGTGGMQLGQLTNQSIIDEDGSISNFSSVFDFSSQNIMLSSGADYTFVITGPLRFFFDEGNGYPDGEIFFDNAFSAPNDLHFEVDLDTPLPVELTSFTAESSEHHTTLTWKTATETNNQKFEIEESMEGRTFYKVGEVEGRGTTYTPQQYDFQVNNQRAGTLYYRLKQIDFDGRFEYSHIISVTSKGGQGSMGTFYPNPTKPGLVYLDYNAPDSQVIELTIFDRAGKLILREFHQVSTGDNQLSIDCSDLNLGVYVAKIGDEHHAIHRKLVIE